MADSPQAARAEQSFRTSCQGRLSRSSPAHQPDALTLRAQAPHKPHRQHLSIGPIAPGEHLDSTCPTPRKVLTSRSIEAMPAFDKLCPAARKPLRFCDCRDPVEGFVRGLRALDVKIIAASMVHHMTGGAAGSRAHFALGKKTARRVESCGRPALFTASPPAPAVATDPNRSHLQTGNRPQFSCLDKTSCEQTRQVPSPDRDSSPCWFPYWRDPL